MNALALQCEIYCAASYICDESYCTVDVVAERLNQFTRLSLGHHRLLFVTAVEREVYVFLGVILHTLSLTFVEFDQIETNLDDHVFHLSHEAFAILFVARRNIQGFHQVDN